MVKVARNVICFYRYTRRRRVNPFFIFNILSVEVIWIVLFPDWGSVCYIVSTTLSFLVAWGLWEYVKEVKAVRRRAQRTPVVRGRLFIGRDGVEVPLGDATMVVHHTCSTVDYTSTTSTGIPPRPTPPPGPPLPPFHPLTNEDFKKLLGDEVKKEPHIPKVRKIRGK